MAAAGLGLWDGDVLGLGLWTWDGMDACGGGWFYEPLLSSGDVREATRNSCAEGVHVQVWLV